MVMTTARPWKTAGLSGNRRSFSPTIAIRSKVRIESAYSVSFR